MRVATVAARAADAAVALGATGDSLAKLVRRVDLRLGAATVHLEAEALGAALDVPPRDLAPSLLQFEAAFALRRRGAGTRIVTGATIPEPDQSLLRILGQARGWARGHRGGSPPAQLSQASGRSVPYVRERIGLAFLSPKLQAAILKGRQPPDLTLERLLRQDIPLDWDEQHARFGLL